MADDYTISIAIVGDNKLSGTLRMSSDDLKRFSNETRNATQNTAQMDSTLTRLRGAVTGFVGALALRQVIGFAEEMNELGTQVHANRVLFDQLTQSWGDSAESLQRLRAATGGVVDDMTLMSGANQLLRLNITETSRDTADLIGMIQRLKQPTQSTTDAIQNFALMLSNESLLRLDSFGISSANVKRRMDELGQSFREATMAEMGVQIERLGSAADVAITPLSRIQTIIENIGQELSGNFTIGINALAGLAIAGIERAAYEQRITDVINRLGASTSTGAVGDLLNAQYNATEFDTADQQIAARATVAWIDRLAVSITRATQPMRDWVDVQREAREEQQRFNLLRSEWDTKYPFPPSAFIAPDSYEVELEALRSRGRSALGGVTIYSSEDAQRASELAEWSQRIVDNIDELQPFIDGGLIAQSDIDAMRTLADETADFAKEAEKGAKALHDASLTALLGQGGGARSFMDLGALSLSAIADTGIADEELARLTDAVQLATGEQTANSLALRDEILPLLSDIYSQQGQDAYIQALQGLSTAIQNSWANGTPLTPDTMMRSLGWMYQPGSIGGASFTVRPGDTPSGIAAETGLTLDQIAAASGWIPGQNWTFQAGTYQIGGGNLMRTGGIGDALGGITNVIDVIRSTADVALDPMVMASESIVSSVENVRGILDDISSTVHKVTIDLDVRTSPLLQWLFTQSGNGRDWLTKIVTDNGGVVPGTTGNIP